MKLCDNNVAYIGLFLWINACFLKQGGSVQYTSTVKYTVVISKLWPIVIFIILIVIILLWTSVYYLFFADKIKECFFQYSEFWMQDK